MEKVKRYMLAGRLHNGVCTVLSFRERESAIEYKLATSGECVITEVEVNVPPLKPTRPTKQELTAAIETLRESFEALNDALRGLDAPRACLGE